MGIRPHAPAGPDARARTQAIRDLMWAVLNTKEFLLSVVKPAAYALSTDLPPDKVVEIPQDGSANVVVKAVREQDAKGQIRLAADNPPRGLTVRAGSIATGKDEATLTLRVARQLAVGFSRNLIITGTMKVGKETITRVAPAVPIKVVAAPKK